MIEALEPDPTVVVFVDPVLLKNEVEFVLGWWPTVPKLGLDLSFSETSESVLPYCLPISLLYFCNFCNTLALILLDISALNTRINPLLSVEISILPITSTGVGLANEVVTGVFVAGILSCPPFCESFSLIMSTSSDGSKNSSDSSQIGSFDRDNVFEVSSGAM